MKGGNTESPSSPANCDKIRYDFQHWTGTLNNYTKEDIQLLPTLPDLVKYCYQEEIGENGTPHIQFLISFNKRLSIKKLKSNFTTRAHLQPIKDWIKCLEYCHKLDTRNGKIISNIPEVLQRIKIEKKAQLEYYKIDEFLPWQKELYEMTLTKPDKRKIIWIYDPEGNNGKSQFMRTLRICESNRIICCNGGKESDIVNMINNCIEDGFEIIQHNLTILIDLPRSKANNEGKPFISYTLLENLKNAFCVNTKYKSKMIEFNTPHIIILSNHQPDYEEMTFDKLSDSVYTIINQKLIKYK